MALEVRVPREILDYEEKIIGGLSLKQLKYTAISIVVGVILYICFAPLIGIDKTTNIIIIGVLPIASLGFVKVKGYELSKYIKIRYNHAFSEKQYFYKTQLTTDEILGISIKSKSKIKKEVLDEKSSNLNINKRKRTKQTKSIVKKAKKDFKSTKKKYKRKGNKSDKLKKQKETTTN